MSNNAKECLVKTSSITRTTSFRFPDAPSPGAGPLLRALQKRSWDTVSESLADTASHGEHGLNRLHPNKKKKSNDHDRARGFSSSGHSSASTVVDSQSAASPPSDGKDSHGVHEHTGEGVRLSRALQRAQAVLCVLLTPSASDFDSFLNRLQCPALSARLQAPPCSIPLCDLERCGLLLFALQAAPQLAAVPYQPVLKWSQSRALQRWFALPAFSSLQSIGLQCAYYLNHDRPVFTGERSHKKAVGLLNRIKGYAAQVKRSSLGTSPSFLSAVPDCLHTEWVYLQRFAVKLNKLSFRLSLLQVVLDDCVATRERFAHYCLEAKVTQTALCEYLESLPSLLVALLEALGQLGRALAQSSVKDEGVLTVERWPGFLERLERAVMPKGAPSSCLGMPIDCSDNTVVLAGQPFGGNQSCNPSSAIKSPAAVHSRLCALRSSATLPSLSL